VPLTAHWFLPTNGDGRHLVGGGHGVATGSAGAIRPASIGYLAKIARAAEGLGFAEPSSRPAHGARTPG
jgi:alkanesulfonate monooxygenase